MRRVQVHTRLCLKKEDFNRSLQRDSGIPDNSSDYILKTAGWIILESSNLRGLQEVPPKSQRLTRAKICFLCPLYFSWIPPGLCSQTSSLRDNGGLTSHHLGITVIVGKQIKGDGVCIDSLTHICLDTSFHREPTANRQQVHAWFRRQPQILVSCVPVTPIGAWRCWWIYNLDYP